MSEQSVNGPKYLMRRGWKPSRFPSRWDSPEQSIRNATTEQAEEFQHARDAAALDRVLALCGDRERVYALIAGEQRNMLMRGMEAAGALLLAAEITRLVGAHGASASGEEKEAGHGSA